MRYQTFNKLVLISTFIIIYAFLQIKIPSEHFSSIINNITSTSKLSNNNNDDIMLRLRPYPKWCPNIKKEQCIQRTYCKPCNRRYLFILAQGRSGSTTVRNMINMLPNIRIRGEISSTSQIFKHMIRYFTDVGAVTTSGMRYNGAFGHYDYPHNHLLCTSQQFIEELDPPEILNEVDMGDTILGFKEVKVTNDTMDFLINNFPCSKYIFNIRSNTTALLQSREKAFKNTEKVGNSVLHLHEIHKSTLQLLGKEQVYLLDMDQWSFKNGVAYFNNVAKWLGYTNCTYKIVRHDNYGQRYNLDNKNDIMDLGNNCRLVD